MWTTCLVLIDSAEGALRMRGDDAVRLERRQMPAATLWIVRPVRHRRRLQQEHRGRTLHRRCAWRSRACSRTPAPDHRPTADDLEHVGGGGLLLQGFGKFAGARLHFLEQTDIADRDHGLIGKGLQQGDLLVAERIHFEPAKSDRADAVAFVKQWDAQNGAVALIPRSRLRFGKFVALGRTHVVHMHRPLFEDGASGRPVRVDLR